LGNKGELSQNLPRNATEPVDVRGERGIVKQEQDLARAIELLSRIQAVNAAISVDGGREYPEEEVLTQDEIIRRLRPLRLLLVAKDCDLGYSTVLRMSKGGIVHRRTLKVVSDYLIRQGKN
jgi:hypothetical protein